MVNGEMAGRSRVLMIAIRIILRLNSCQGYNNFIKQIRIDTTIAVRETINSS
jgi:hypothetical protein